MVITYLLGYLSEEQWISALSENPHDRKEIVDYMKKQEERYSFKFEKTRKLYPKLW